MRKSTILLGVVVCLALAALAVAHTRATQAGAERRTEEATAIVRAFLGDPDAEFYAPFGPEADRPSYWTLDMREGFGTFTVDLDYQMVIIAVMTDPDRASGPDIPPEKALEAARAFLAPRVPDLEDLTLVRQVLQDHGRGAREYDFEWRLLVGPEGVRAMRSVTISVDAATGEVVSFTQAPALPLTVDVEPTISRERALAIATEHFGTRVVQSELTLDVWWRDIVRRDEQALRWTVRLAGDLPEELLQAWPTRESHMPPYEREHIYHIDAHTGEIMAVLASCCS